MGICYLCERDKKLNSEHIIPQCLGGVLTATLYCTECNGECGHNVDVELARQFGRYATLLQVARERGENQPFTIVEEQSGIRLRCDGKMFTRADPSVRIETDESGVLTEAEVLARSERELKAILKRIAEKYNIDPNLGVFELVENPPPEASHEFVLDNMLIRRTVAKIAYGFACMKLPEDQVRSKEFDPIRAFILGTSDDSRASANFAHGNFMVDNQRPLHKVHLRLDRAARLLVGYVALFGTFRYTVLLADGIVSEVEWAGIDYTYNPVTQREVEGNENFVAPRISRDDVLAPKHSKEQVLAALQRGHEVIAAHSTVLKEVHLEAVPGDGT